MFWHGETMDPEVPLQRIRLLITAVGFAALMLVGRLWWVQIACGKQYERISTGTRMRHIPVPAPRGLIYDCNGNLMASTLMQYMVVVDPVELRRLKATERATVFSRAASILGISVPQIQDTLDRSRQAGFNTIKLKSGVGPAVITHILEEASELPGIDVQRVPARSYPMGAVGAHVLGYLGDVRSDDYDRINGKNYNGADQIGEQGLERFYEQDLRGKDGERVVEVNAHGVPVSSQSASDIDPKPGKTLVLTLDSTLQRVAQEAFPENMKGSVVAIDVRTGGILALASRPGFNPNDFVTDTPEAKKQRTLSLLDPSGPMQDRAITSRYPPGSTFKLVTSAAGFANNDINVNNTVYCAGGLKIGTHGQFKKCWSVHGTVDYLKAMAQSCDTYFYDLMSRLTSTQLASMCRSFGLGCYSGIDLPSESRGFVPTPAWKDQRFTDDRWMYGDSCNMAIGQGFLQVTPLQMALVTAAVANGGNWLKPHLVQSVKDSQGNVIRRIEPHVNGKVPVSNWALSQIREGMHLAVGQHGTANIVRFKGLDVAAKTGSAQDLPNPQTHAWFVCYAPYDHPQIAICSMVEHGGHGGQTAGPIARAILKAYFHLKESGSSPSGQTD